VSDETIFSRIIALLYGSLSIDARVLREVKALSDSGYYQTVLDTELGFGRWTSFKGVKNHPIIRMEPQQRTGIRFMIKFWFKCLRYMLERRKYIEVVHAHDLSALPPAAIFSLLNPNAKVIYDSHELFPEAAGEKISVLLQVIFLGIELIFSRFVDRLITVSPSIVKILSKRVNAPSSLIMNFPDLERVKDVHGEIPQWKGPRNDDKIRIAYSGIVMENRGYEKLLDTVEILQEKYGCDSEFWIIGDGPFLDELKKLVYERNLGNYFKFTGRVNFEELLALTSECDLAIALYDAATNNDAGLSNKLFEYMMIGVPFIFTNLIQSMPILEQVDSVIIENPVSAIALADAIFSLRNNPAKMNQISQKSKRLVATRLNWQREAEKLLRIYDETFFKSDHVH
jgi:glycosyltransferase involved in cell wall biosynthesis